MLGAILSIGGALLGASSANKAAKAQKDAANSEIALARETRDLVRSDLAPYNNVNAVNALSYLNGIGEKPEGFAGFQETPGYQFAFNEGQRALEGSAAASGGLNSGRFLKATTQYGQNMANQEFGNFYSRLAGQAANAQSAAAGQGAAAQNYSATAGNALNNIGNAQAAGSIATGNALSGLAGNLSGLYGYQKATNASNNPFGSGSIW